MSIYQQWLSQKLSLVHYWQPQVQIMPKVCGKMWIVFYFLAMLIKFHSVNLQICMYQPCLVLNTLGYRRGVFNVWGHRTPFHFESSENSQDHGQNMHNQVFSSIRCGLQTPWERPLPPLLWIHRAWGLCRTKDPHVGLILGWDCQRGSWLLHWTTEGGWEPMGLPPKQLSLTQISISTPSW